MDVEVILDAITKQGIWCLLFCYLFLTSQKDNKEREAKLIEKLDHYNDALAENTKTLENINSRLTIVEEEIH